jgi:hypothetical protein
MNNKTKGKGGNILKGMAIGLALGTAVTMVVAGNKKMSQKMQNATETMTDGISNLMNFK